MRINKYHIVVIGLMIAAIVLRLISSKYNVLLNFAPIAAITLFGASTFKNKAYGLAIPFLYLFISDAIIGFHNMMYFTYGSYFLIALLGSSLLKEKVTVARLAISSLSASVIFFIISNFGVWAVGGFYAHTSADLVKCFVSAIPFFGNTVAGDLFYSALIFGAFEYIKQTNWLVKAKV
jgi:hypothetical protein